MAKAIVAEAHQWVAATTIPIEGVAAGRAQKIGSLTLVTETFVNILEVYCEQCRRPFDDVADQQCVVAAEGNEHLRGGPIGTRKKRMCQQHGVLYKACEELHTGPVTYGRPPMPRVPANH